MHLPRASDPARTAQRRLLRWGQLAAAALLAALAGPALAGLIYGGDDLLALYLPLRAYCAEQFAHGEPADWMPGLFCGFDLTGEGEAASYHPLHRSLYRFLPLPLAWNLELFLKYPFMLAGGYLFLRSLLGRRDAAMLGATAFAFSGFTLLHFVHPGAIAVVAHLPWLLWAIGGVIRGGSPRRLGWLLPTVALLTASQLLMGYPQYVFFSLLAEGAAVLFALRSLATWKERWAVLAWLTAAKFAGWMLAGVQFLPTLDALAASARAHPGVDFQTWGSLHPLNLVQLVAPYLFSTRVVGQNTHELGCYLGAVPLLLALWAVARRRELGPWRAPAQAAAACAVVFLLLALGKYAPLYRIQQFLPLVNHFRFPARYIVLVQGAVAVLAAIGFAHLAARQENRAATRPQGRRMLRLVCAAGVVAALVGLCLQGRPHLAGPLPILAGPLLLGLAALLIDQADRGCRWALAGLIVLAAADLGAYGLSYVVYPQATRWDRYLARIDRPPQHHGGRVLADLARWDQPVMHTGNQILLAGFERADGYVGLEPRRRLDLASLAALRVAGVEWVRDHPQTAAIAGLPPARQGWRPVPRPLPRVRLVSHAVTSPGGSQPVVLDGIDVERTAVVDEPLALSSSEPGRACIHSYRPGRMEIDLDVPTRQLLVVAESFHPGWHARLDGRDAPLIRVYGDFLGCVVGRDARRLELEYRPASLARGSALSGLGILGVCLLGLVPLASYQCTPRRPQASTLR